MAVNILKSGVITNRDASPKVISDSSLSKGDLMEAVGTVQSVSGDSIGSTYIFATIRSNARVSSLIMSCDGAGTTTIADFGLYQTTLNGSAVVDADFFASAQALTTALKNSDITHESGVYGIEDVEKPLWEALGLSEDPHIAYDVVATLTAASDATDDISVKIAYAM